MKISATIIKASKALCKSVISELGGSTEVAKLSGLSRQHVCNYETAGYVPLKRAYQISRGTGVDQWAISYLKLLEVFGESSKAFNAVVKDAPIAAETKKAILKIYNS